MGPAAMFYVMLGASALAGAVIGVMLLSRGWRRAYGAILAAHVFAATGLWLSLQQGGAAAHQFHALALVMLVLPSGLGMILGGAAAVWRQRNQ